MLATDPPVAEIEDVSRVSHHPIYDHMCTCCIEKFIFRDAHHCRVMAKASQLYTSIITNHHLALIEAGILYL